MATFSHESAFTQFDLFADSDFAAPTEAESIDWAPLVAARLSDAELIAVLPRARQVAVTALTREAAQRRLAGAVPALEALCRRFSGFGLDREVTEQVTALRCLAELGGSGATAAVTRLIVSRAVRGPGLRVALDAAATLGARLPANLVAEFLRNDDPVIRQAACRCARSGAEVTAMLVDLLSDLHRPVSHAAAFALARLGRREAAPVLAHLLQTAPDAEVVQALAGIADDDDWVRLGQAALQKPELVAAVLAVLEDSEVPRAARVAQGVRRRLQSEP